MSQVKCFICRKKTYGKCPRCGTAYCCQKCLNKDPASHAVFCHPLLEDRLKAIADIVVDRVGPRSLTDKLYPWSICCGFNGSKPGSHLGTLGVILSAFGRPWDDCCCVICSEKNRAREDSNDMTHHFLYRDVAFGYMLCNRCHDSGRKLCPQWMRCTTKCTNTKSWWTFLMCLQRASARVPSVPKDIKRMIFSLVKPCEC